MPTCATCGHESERDFVFCPACGTRREGAQGARELRKTITALFCDLAGSTSLGETVDPEALRLVLADYFARARAIVESHGGTVEKFAGDAVMAVFGVPVVHEDDALRAVRAALEIAEAVTELGLEARIGVNTGEVVVGTEERLATGDAVNVAARLEQAASPGEVLIGEETARRVRGAVDAEPVEPLTLKGKSAPVVAYRLLAVREPPPRQFGTPLVGRDAELRALSDAFARAQEERSCQLCTILGPAGVGKSRLAAEFARRVDARVVAGRCLSYGQGITYRPLVEVVQQLDELPPDETAAAALRSLLGESAAPTSADEIAWATRKLLEHAAREQALICVLDDLHWAEATFLDLVEHVALLARGTPILLLCLSRPELLDARPGWAAAKPDATTLRLQPLDAAETERLLGALGGVSPALREQIVAAADGNPLFVEEMVALVRESGGEEVSVPPTIQALLAARLDQLDPVERSVLERGAVEGRVFHWSALQALSDDDADVSTSLLALVRKDLLRPDSADVGDDDAYRFRHVLIRDAAYEALPKTLRATLHERFADWLEGRQGARGSGEEILGHHLEQAVRYRRELRLPHEELAERAGEVLATAGRRALWRGDDGAARGLLGRALELLPTDRANVALRLELASFASVQELPQQAAAVAAEAAERAAAHGDAAGEAAARVVEAFNRLLAGEGGVDELDARAQAALPLLEAAGDHDGLVHVWRAIGYGIANARGQYAEWARAAEQALLHARFAGQRPTHLFSLEVTLVVGPTPAEEAIARLDRFLSERPHPYPLLFRAQLLAMLGRFDEAWPSARAASERLRELTGGADGGEYALAEIAALEGDHAIAAEHLRSFCTFLEAHEQRGLLSTFAPMLGRTLVALGRPDEAEPQAQLGRELGEEHDVATQALWRQVQARVESHRGRHDAAEALAREAVALIEQTDALNFQGAALADLAEVLRAAGRDEEAAQAFAAAVDRYERKQNVAAAEQARSRCAALGLPTLSV